MSARNRRPVLVGLAAALLAFGLLSGLRVGAEERRIEPEPATIVARTCLAAHEDFAGTTRVTVADRVTVDLHCGDRYVVRGGRCGVERVGAPRVEVPCLRPEVLGLIGATPLDLP